MRPFVFFVTLVPVLGQPLLALDGPVKLTLPDVVQAALTKNASLAVRKLDPPIARTRVMWERGAFDDTVSLQVQKQHTEAPTGSQLDGAKVSVTDVNTGNLGLATKFREGSTFGVNFNNQKNDSNSRFQTLNPYYQSTLVVNLTKPLLRGAGHRVNTAGIEIAKLGVRQSHYLLAKQVLDTVAQAERQYWDLLFARRDLEVKQQALDLARELLAYNTRRQEVGLGSDVQVVEAQTSEATRLDDLEISRRLVQDAQELLRRTISLRGQPPGVELLPVSEPPPIPAGVPLTDALAMAYAKRPDYQNLVLDLQSKNIRVVYLKSQRLPRIDLITSYSQNGLDATYADALDQVTRGDYDSYTLGFKVELPLQNRLARADYRKGLLEKQQALLSLKAMEDQMEDEVTRAVRSLDTGIKRVSISNRAAELSARHLKAAETRYQQGLIANFDLLRFQQDLRDARSRALQAMVNTLKNRIDVEATTGHLLESRRIVVESLQPPLPPELLKKGKGLWH
ncbi:MAG: TolC family protein [Candidatus Riflebacteria bacterium]|nr:TolC family protein [Candidatus Riflebacteria bacterium]